MLLPRLIVSRRLWQAWLCLVLLAWALLVFLVWCAMQGLAGAIVLGDIIERALNG